jgi:hypothetical protein
MRFLRSSDATLTDFISREQSNPEASPHDPAAAADLRGRGS